MYRPGTQKFYKKSHVETTDAGFAILLDGRSIKTPPVYAQVLLVAALSLFGVAVAAAKFSIVLRLSAITVLLVSGWGAGIAAYQTAGIMFPLIPSSLALRLMVASRTYILRKSNSPPMLTQIPPIKAITI